jgi:hypothetical protein
VIRILLLIVFLFFLPFILLRFVFKLAVALFVLPFAMLALLLGFAAAFVALLFALLIPLLPVAFLVFCVVVIVRLSSRPSVFST